VGGIGVSEAMQFLYFFISFWNPKQPCDFLFLVLGQKLSIILSGSPKAMQLTKPNFRTCLEALKPSTLLKSWKEIRNTIIIDRHSDKIKTEIPLFSRTMSSNSARDLFTLRSASSVS